jgi:uncharacterized OB-fold protein
VPKHSEGIQQFISRPSLSRDYDFFLDGLVRHRLLVQQCSRCGTLRHPPGPMCPECQSLLWTERALSGRGIVHSYTVHYRPPIPPYQSPHTVVLADMEEGVRVLAAIAGCPIADIQIGLEVDTVFEDLGPDFTLHRFRRRDRDRP